MIISVYGWILVALGGALGAMTRLIMSHHVSNVFGTALAWGTLSVNVIGSFLMGFFAIFLTDKLNASIELRAFIMIGFLGAFTTFSTFSFETIQYLEASEFARAFLNIGLSVFTCVFAVWGGMLVGRLL